MEPKSETAPPFSNPSTSDFIGLEPICVSDQVHFVVWVESTLPFTFFR